MMSTTIFSNILIPSDLDVSMAREALRLLNDLHLEEGQALDMQIGGKAASLPASVARMLLGTLHEMAAGKAVAVVPLDEEVTPNEAGEILLVSRPTVMKLIETGKIPFRMEGTHHRLNMRDVVAYKQKRDAERDAALREMVALAQEFNLGY